MSCEKGYRLNILNAYLFDSGNLLNNNNNNNNATCSPKSDQNQIIRIITDDFNSFCMSGTNTIGGEYSRSNCSITESFLINAQSFFSVPVKCLSADVFYACVIAFSKILF